MITDPASMTPLLPSMDARGVRELVDKAENLIRRADRQEIPRGLRPVLADALRPMNSYYTNKIEGQHTTPLLIEQALQQDFSAKPDEARKQRAALACILAEEHIEARVGNAKHLGDIEDYFQAAFIQSTHRAMYQHLPPEDRLVFGKEEDGSDWREDVLPGVFRTHEVKVGEHIPPSYRCMDRFFEALWNHYRFEQNGSRALIAIFAAHHRLAWLHPFGDGNGRAVRLHTHAGLYALGLTRGIWSPMRGLARQQGRYYQMLALADHPREGDLDGRGNLSEKHLIGFIDFMLDVCLDQVEFMERMLDLNGLELRIHKMLQAESVSPETPNLLKLNSLAALKYLLNAGPTPKQEFRLFLGGDSERTQERVIKDLRTLGIITSDGLQAPFRLSIPIKLFRYLFPGLWIEAEDRSPS
ncbi:Fic family protein [Chitinolyticbacter albus]|uniref:Fic family protein n=1 Tax=Chitinolyticbacter albus TaxID=2961951 RepID=UPI002108E4EE|nr:Fic family protein [Chitinolyticbacter albus]